MLDILVDQTVQNQNHKVFQSRFFSVLFLCSRFGVEYLGGSASI